MAFFNALFGWRGRIGRLQFVGLSLPYFALWFALQYALVVMTSNIRPQNDLAASWISFLNSSLTSTAQGKPPLLGILYVVLALLLFLSACIRRLRDRGQSV